MIRLLDRVDLAVFLLAALLLLSAGIRAGLRRRDAEGYFMADRNLRWWSVAGSIYGTNVSLAQIIGMLGIGYSIGFAQSHYEVLAVPAILLLCYVFIPVYRRRSVFTLAEFLGARYDGRARLLYTLVIISVILILLVGGLYIGSRQLGLLFSDTHSGVGYLQGILLIAGVACLLVLFGGMSSVVAAENIITLLMVAAVVVVGWCTLSQPSIGGIGGLLRLDGSPGTGMGRMALYLPSDHPDLPWTGVFSGLLVLHGFFWTTNQFEVQRVLAARSDRDAKLGAIAAGFLKLTIPFFSIAAGVAAAYLFRDAYGLGHVKPDDAFIMLMDRVVPRGYGLHGLILAGFTGAIFSSIYSMLNSASTLLTVDVYRRYVRPDASDRQMVFFGKASVLALCIAAAWLAYASFDPDADGNFFLTLSKNTSYLKPGVVSAFLLGVLWRRAHPASAVLVILAAPLFSVALEWIYSEFLSMVPFWRGLLGARLNFLHRVFVVFVLCVLIQVVFSVVVSRKDGYSGSDHGIVVDLSGFRRPFLQLLAMHLFLLSLVGLAGMSARSLSWFAAFGTFLVFPGAFGVSLLRSDRFYAGLLAGFTAWVLYFFA